jgi:hypothetical protein
MRNLAFVALATVAFSTLCAVPAIAAEKNLGKISKDDLRTACNKAGGTLLGVSDSGSYGCENEKTGGMILCNKQTECTGYTPAKTNAEINRITEGMDLRIKPPVAR